MTEVLKVEDCGNTIGDYDVPIYKAIIISEGASNGDMIMTMFPNIEIEGVGGLEGFQCIAVNIGLGTSYFALDWWNAPYKKNCETKQGLEYADQESIMPTT